MTLLEECLEALDGASCIDDDSEKNLIFKEFLEKFPFTNWGRIKWENVKVIKEGVYSYDFIPRIVEYIDNPQSEALILWDEMTLPIVKSKLDKAISVIDDVSAVSSNTWIYIPSEEVVVEFYHDGNITIGSK